ncbi:BlaI/MecI/CopY family transcriptional regulator [soil metagenome]
MSEPAASEPPHVTVAESELLAVLWRHGPLSATALVEAVRARQPWGEATIKTLLNRLMRKSLVRSQKDDGRQRYHPLLDREAYVRAEAQGLADRLFAGDLSAVAALLSKG